MLSGLVSESDIGFRNPDPRKTNQAATDAKQQPGFQTNTRDARTRAGKLRATLMALVARRALRLRLVSAVRHRLRARLREYLHQGLREYRAQRMTRGDSPVLCASRRFARESPGWRCFPTRFARRSSRQIFVCRSKFCPTV